MTKQTSRTTLIVVAILSVLIYSVGGLGAATRAGAAAPGLSAAAQDLSASTPGGVVGIVSDAWSDNVTNTEQHAFGLDGSGHVHHW